MTKFYMMVIAKKTDDSHCDEMNEDIVFEKKSELKEYLKSEGYFKETKNQYIKMDNEAMYIATVEKIKVK
ncbi:hypothetical protein ACIQXI_02415 [Lysinibacillus sp. NPDC097195]|uniref:hypothetical protein n=1 Tax=Lysinibacillus sp. NPDC097195 TaxID=3364141 RepID=UPI00381014BE